MLREKLEKDLTKGELKQLKDSVCSGANVTESTYNRFLGGSYKNFAIGKHLCHHLRCTPDELLDQDHKFTCLVAAPLSIVTP